MSASELPAILGGPPIRPDGPPSWPIDDTAVREALARMADDGAWGRYHGPHCRRLQEALRERHECEHAILCSSGTAAVELALRGLKVGAGDEVILAAYDFKANFTNVLTLGATPVLVDIRADDWQLDVEQVAGALSGRTAAVIASHLHGKIVDMPRLRAVCDEHGVPIIEDACQAQGATIHGRPPGMWGHVGVLSFGGSKLLTAGRGGAILTRRDDVAQRIKLYTQRGNDAYPLSEMQAAVLLPQLEALPERQERRKTSVAQLREMLAQREPGAPELIHALNSPQRDGCDPAYYKLAFRCDGARIEGLTRDRIAEAFRAEGIALDPGFRALHFIHSRRRFRAAGELPIADETDRQALVLHHPVLLGEAADLRQIVAAVDKIERHATMLVPPNE